jgi:hypothetical protein
MQLFMKYSLEWPRDKLGEAYTYIVGGFVLVYMLATPVAARLARRFNPALVMGWGCGFCGTMCIVFTISAYVFRASYQVSFCFMFVGAAGFFGVAVTLFFLNRRICSVWLVDEDQLRRFEPGKPLPVRRDGLLESLGLALTTFGGSGSSVIFMVIGWAGYDQSLDEGKEKHGQSELVCYTIAVAYVGSVLVLLLLNSVVLLCFFPLVGSRLDKLKEDYAHLHAMEMRYSDKRWPAQLEKHEAVQESEEWGSNFDWASFESAEEDFPRTKLNRVRKFDGRLAG